MIMKKKILVAALEVVKFAVGVILGLLGASCTGFHGYGYLSCLDF